jgi:hypothetical protein
MRRAVRNLSIFSAGGIAALLVVSRRGLRRGSPPVECASVSASKGSQNDRNGRSRTAIAVSALIALVATAGFAVLALYVYRSYNRAEPSLADPARLGGVYLFFNVPGVTAHLDVDVDTNLDQDLSIWVYPAAMKPGEHLTYSVVLTGSAMPSAVYPAGIPREVDKDGCYRGSVSADDLADPQRRTARCSRSKGAPDAVYASGPGLEPVYVIEGHLTPDTKGNASAYINVVTVGGDTADNGAQSTFVLPTVGSTTLPAAAMDSFTAIVAGHPNLHPPSLVNEVRYKYLEPSDDLQNVSPEPDSRTPLTWISDNSITASGTIVDDLEQRQQDRHVFFWGVLAGVLGGLFPGLLVLWRRVFLLPENSQRGRTRATSASRKQGVSTSSSPSSAS